MTTPDLTDPWGKAFQSLTDAEKDQLKYFREDRRTNVQGALDEAQAKREAVLQKRWKFERSDGTVIILRDVFEKIVRWISKYANGMDVLANADPIHAGLAWGAVRFLLQSTISDSQTFGIMSDGLEFVTRILARYAILEKIYLQSAVSGPMERIHLDQFVINVYAAVLKYLARVTRYWSQRSATRLAQSIFGSLEAEQLTLQSAVSKADEDTKAAMDMVQYQTSEAVLQQQNLITMAQQQSSTTVERNHSSMALVQQEILMNQSATTASLLTKLHELQQPFLRIGQDVSAIRDQLSQDERLKVFHWLSTVPCETYHSDGYKKILKGTGLWLLQHPEFKAWQISSCSSIFWIHGIPGAGKSKLTSLVIQTMLDLYDSAPGSAAPVAYFYCSNKTGDSRNTVPEEALRSILRQLTGRESTLPLRGSVAQEYGRRREKETETGAGIKPLDAEEVVKYILDITAVDPVTIVIDALDEVDGSRRDVLFDALERIIQESQNVVKLFISSRNDGDIVEKFKQNPNVGITSELNRLDIEGFVHSKIEAAIKSKKILRGRVSTELRTEICNTLIAKSQGMFRWVELSIEMLSNSRRLSVERDIRTELGKLPPELKNQYAAIYEEITEFASSTASIVRRTFSWLLAAQRTLTMEELLAAVALDEDGFYHKDLDSSCLLDICRNFIMEASGTDAGSDTAIKMRSTGATTRVQFAHLSVKEFLQDLPEFYRKTIHDLAVWRCIRDFGVDLPGQDDCLNNPGAFNSYTVYLFEHAEKSNLSEQDATPPLALRMKNFLFDPTYKKTAIFEKWESRLHLYPRGNLYGKAPRVLFQYHYNRGYVDGEDRWILLLSSHDLLSVLELLKCEGYFSSDVAVTRKGDGILREAVARNKFRAAKWILENQVFEIAIGGNPKLLYCALTYGSADIVDLLLNNGVYPLHAVADVDASKDVFSALSRQRNLDILTRVVDHIDEMQKDSNSNFSSDWKSHALIETVLVGWESGSLLLIERGADVRAKITGPSSGATILQHAIKKSWFVLSQKLLEKSRGILSKQTAEVNPTDYLVRHVEWVNFKDEIGRTALQDLCNGNVSFGAYRGEWEVVMDLLIDNGADVSALTACGESIAHLAAKSGCMWILTNLERRGFDFTVLSHDGSTVLHYATMLESTYQLKDTAMVNFLLNKGIHPLAADRGGMTPLHHAAAYYNNTAILPLANAYLSDQKSAAWNLHKSSPEIDLARLTLGEVEQLRAFANVVDNLGQSPLHLVGQSHWDGWYVDIEYFRFKILEIIRLLVGFGADINKQAADGATPLLNYIRKRRWPMPVEVLLVQGALPDLAGTDGQTPLHHAANSGGKEMVEMLLKHGANPNIGNNNSETALHHACARGYTKVIDVLLKGNADCKVREIRGITPLHLIMGTWLPLLKTSKEREYFSGHYASIFVEKGADVNAVDDMGWTPLHWAAWHGRKRGAVVLLEHGADPDAIDYYGRTALDIGAEFAAVLDENGNFDLEVNWIKKTNQWRLSHHLSTWLVIYKASERIRERNRRPKCSLKRSQSTVLRKDQAWGNFGLVGVGELDKMDPIPGARRKYGKISLESLRT